MDGHSIRVCMLAVRTGIALGLSEGEIQVLADAALLHDIGKIAVAPEILDEPGGLTSELMGEVRRHPEYGYNVLKRMKGISVMVRNAVYEHHENVDGSGYPRGLAGEEISMAARIIHIADVYDALVSERCYKKAMRSDDAVEYLLTEAGKMFDRKILTVFVEQVVGRRSENEEAKV